MKLTTDRRLLVFFIVVALSVMALIMRETSSERSKLRSGGRGVPGEVVAALPPAVHPRHIEELRPLDVNPFRIIPQSEESLMPEATAPVSVSIPILHVSALLLGETPRAIVNGALVSVGDDIGQAQILRIGPDGVQVRFNQVVFVVPPDRAGALGDRHE